MQTSTEVITPEMAERLLQTNTGNRNLRQGHVNELARRMRDGQWRLTHQGIAISTNGRLLDGQHRLQAIVKSGKAVQMTVSRGLAEDAFRAMDQGLKRSMADLAGHDTKVVEIATQIARVIHGASGEKDIDKVEHAILRFGPMIDLTVKGVRNSKVISTAPFRMGVIARMCAEPFQESVIVDRYRALARHDYGSLPTVLQVLAGQIACGSWNGRARNEIATRSFFAFDTARADANRLQVKNMERNLDMMKSVLCAAARES